jgi:putative ABC transport system permease protein
MITEAFNLAYKTLMHKKIRSFLTVVGIFIAIFTVFVLLSMSLGLNEGIQEQFRQLGTDKFFIQPKGSYSGADQTSNIKLTTKDIDTLEKISEIKKVAYYTIGNVQIKFKEETRYYITIAIPFKPVNGWDIFSEVYDIKAEDGRLLKDGDRGKVLLGYGYKHGNFMGKPVNVNDKIELNGVSFDVAGILETVGNSQDDRQIYMTIDDFKELFNSGDRLDFIIVQVKEGENMTQVADKAERVLRKERGVTEKTQDFTVSTPEQLLESFGIVLNILMAFLIGIGSVSIIVGGIGIANTMFTSVLERRKEIGTMKAIGAKNEDILTIFIVESGILGLIGGFLGLVFGIIVAKAIEYYAQQSVGSIIRASMSPYLIIGCLLFGFVIGTISGFFPSRQAAALKPADALRYE